MGSHVVEEINYPYSFDKNIKEEYEDPINRRPKTGVYHDEEQTGRSGPRVRDTDSGKNTSKTWGLHRVLDLMWWSYLVDECP